MQFRDRYYFLSNFYPCSIEITQDQERELYHSP